MEFLEAATWVTIGKIILIDILLAGDNAVVIGMAAGKLAPELQKKAVIWGTVGAILMRLLFATVLVEALTLIPLVHLGGGLVLIWIAIQLLKGDDDRQCYRCSRRCKRSFRACYRRHVDYGTYHRILLYIICSYYPQIPSYSLGWWCTTWMGCR